ncbi:MAG: hypothetical protein D4R95_01550 [Actinobacteria bacterium]|nr:MAG: hypothetical protein D4R95_01550 [Actinomycetota bacterium]
MTESNSSKPFSLPSVEDLLSLLSKLNSTVADIKDDAENVASNSIKGVVDQAKRSVESTASTLQTIQQSLENFNRVALRVDKLLDDVEEPIRRLLGSLPQQPTKQKDA